MQVCSVTILFLIHSSAPHGMSNINIQKILEKILKENVLSGDFKVANFKFNLKNFLKFVSTTFSFLAVVEQELIETTIESLCAKLVASRYTKLKIPQPSRVYLAAVYASQVLGQSFENKESVRNLLKTRYGAQLVFAADSLEQGTC